MGERSEAALAQGPGLELERVLRRVERGQATQEDAVVLARLEADEQIGADLRDRASLGFSTMREAEGNQEGAIRAVEALLARHGGDSKFAAHEDAHRRLRRLVTGEAEAPPTQLRSPEPIAPIASALATFFPEDDRGALLVDVVVVGKPLSARDPWGILNIGGARRELAEKAVCDIDVRAQQSISRIGSWVDLPLQSGEHRADMPNPDRSMVVVYFDLVENRVPARYDAYLALPSAETIARLERGEAFVAVRERAGKKPLVLLAAPRVGQLDQVENELAQMSTLPTTPRTVEVQKSLLAPEIQGAVRNGFSKMRVCYETLLARDPKAEGTIPVRFRIDGAGAAQGVSAADSSFTDATFNDCIAGHFATLRFPASGHETTVTYPVAFSP